MSEAEPKLSLEHELERVRRERARTGMTGRRRKGPQHQGNHSRYSKCGPNGELREHPLLEGLKWVCLFGWALEQMGIAWDSRLATEGWEKTGCVTLHLQRVVHGEVSHLRYIGPLAQQSPKVGIRGGVWEHWRVPVGLVNSKDTRALLRLVLTPKEADLVMAASLPIRAMHSV